VPTGLTGLDEAILLLAASPPTSPGERCNQIRELGMGEMVFYQRLDRLLDTEAALAAHPVAVNRLRRLRRRGRRVTSAV